jgi:hypothetical protein
VCRSWVCGSCSAETGDTAYENWWHKFVSCNSILYNVGAAADSSAKLNLTDTMAGTFRKAMGISAEEPDTAKRTPPLEKPWITPQSFSGNCSVSC